MFDARPTAPRFQFAFAAMLLATAWAGVAAAQSAATNGEQWRAAGVTRPTNVRSAAPATTNAAWQLPNGQPSNAQQPADTAESTEDASNPLRQKQKPQPTANVAAQEPHAFQPPANAKRITPNQSAASSNTVAAKPQAPRQNASAAQYKLPNAATASKQANVRPQPTQVNRPVAPQRPAYQRVVQANAQRHNEKFPGDSLWDSINVAFQGDAPTKSALKNSPEMLPSPGAKSNSSSSNLEMQNPVMRQFDGPGDFVGPYQPYGEPGFDGGNCGPGGSCDSGCCDPACGSCGCPCGDPGCGCEPGCACEPGCGCEACHKDLFCIGPGDDESCHTVRLRWPKWQEVVVFGGVQGFKGPYDQERDSGNFGFNEGFNIGAKVPYAQLGYQFGWRGTQSQLNGDKDTGIDKQFFQQFATAGLFHRQSEGLNFGVVWDVLNDERFNVAQFSQVRSEISLMGGGCHEIGFTGIFGFNDERVNTDDGSDYFQASDQFLLFYRFHGCAGGEGRFFAGCNDDADAIIGSDILIPVGDRFSVQSGFTYLIPNERNGAEGAASEAWNIGMGLVWHWDGQARKSFDNCYRPMFNVADNGTLIVDHRRHED